MKYELRHKGLPVGHYKKHWHADRAMQQELRLNASFRKEDYEIVPVPEGVRCDNPRCDHAR